MNDATHIVLTRAEAVVLFEQLSRFFDDQRSGPTSSIPFDDISEYWAMLGLHGALQKELTEPLTPDYKVVLDWFRAQLRTQRGDTIAQD